MTWLHRVTQAARVADGTIGRVLGPRRVLVYGRTAMNLAILAPIADRLRRDPRVEVLYSAERPSEAARILPPEMTRAVQPGSRMMWQRIDLCLDADAWSRITLRRCRRRAHFFHGTAGKYDLDQPNAREIRFDLYDRVAFINADRMQRYLAAGVVSEHAAALVGFPKVDALVNGEYDAAQIRARLGLEHGRPTAIYAPTWSPASSLHVGGREIVGALIAAGFNVIVKLHDRSLDATDAKYSNGIDWRREFARLGASARLALVENADSSPFLAASDVMVTDHSSIGFEFCLLDRPLIVIHAPDLMRVARINPQKQELLRSAARVVHTPDQLGAAVLDELRHPLRLSDRRRFVAREMFHEPGTATDRAVTMVYELIDLPVPRAGESSMLNPRAVASLS